MTKPEINNSIPPSEQISIQELLDALVDQENILDAKFLYRFSDLSKDDREEIESIWYKMPARRRQALLEDLEELGSRDNLLSFKRIGKLALKDKDPYVRKLAVQTLWVFESPKLTSVFIDLVENDDDHHVRANAAYGLGQYVYMGELGKLSKNRLKKIETILINAVKGSDEDLVRQRALEALGYSSREDVKVIIEEAYHHGEKGWVKSSLVAMGRSYRRSWAPLVFDMLENQHPEVRCEAVRAAGELEDTRSVQSLIDLLEDVDNNVRDAAIWSLSQIGGEGVRDVLEELFRDTQDDRDYDYIRSALDNLSFTEGEQNISLLDFSDVLDNDIEENASGTADYLDLSGNNTDI